MTKVRFVTSDGHICEVDAVDSDSMMRTAIKNGVPGIIGECGGEMACGTCHVFVDEAWIDRIPEPGSEELDMLGIFEDDEPGSRLSCQIKVRPELDGLTVTVAQNS